jgi:hypothetical protein
MAIILQGVHIAGNVVIVVNTAITRNVSVVGMYPGRVIRELRVGEVKLVLQLEE